MSGEFRMPTHKESSLKLSVAMGELLRLRDLGEDVLGQEILYDVIAAIACLDRVQQDVDNNLFDCQNIFTQE